MNREPSDMPTVYDPQSVEPEVAAFWDAGGYGQADPDDRPAQRRFSIVIPPPNVTGALHLGHAINNVLQDILIRWKRMCGFNTLWLPGTDHAGIATQAVVERRLLAEEGKTRQDLGRDELVARIWRWKHEYESRIIEQLKRMGCSCDWRRTRFTLDERCARAVRHTFFQFFKNGLVYRGTRLVNWDTQLQTAVADDEVYHETVKGFFWHLRYPLKDPRPDDPEYVVVATTRPETMLGDTAVAVNPNDERYKRLVGRSVILPLMQRQMPIIADEWADPQKGSGCVKITPAHDPNDYEVGLRHGLPMINVLRSDGKINAAGGRFAGMDRYVARKEIVAALEAEGLVEKVEEYETQIGHSDRSRTPIEPFLSEQWFVHMADLAQTAIDAVLAGKVRFFPERYERTYLDWLGEKRDWCISRQLWWGHRIPIWHCATCGEQELKGAFGGREDICWQPAPEGRGLLICSRDHDLTDADLPAHALRQDPDVLDTWFSSALWPHSTLGWPADTPELGYYYPTSVLVTSRDIITLWVARMVMTGLHNMGHVPFHDVYIHTKILDGQGRTMSKSAGNGVDPLDIIERQGADALRFTLATMATETQDVRLPVKPEALPDGRTINTSERFDLGRNFCNKLWNAARFAFMNLGGVACEPLELAQLPIEDRWILSQLGAAAAQINDHLERYAFSSAAAAAQTFFWNKLCDWYLELVKFRLRDDDRAPECRQVLALCLDWSLRLLHPFIPFITERIWRELNRVAPQRGLPDVLENVVTDALAVAPFPHAEVLDLLGDEQTERIFADLQDATRGVRDVRSRCNVPPRQKVNIIVRTSRERAESLRREAHIVRYLAGVGSLTIDPSAGRPPNAAGIVVGDLQLFVLEVIDDTAERQRLGRRIDDVQTQIQRAEAKLANERFLANAPPDIIERQRARLAELQNLRQTLTQSLAELQDP